MLSYHQFTALATLRCCRFHGQGSPLGGPCSSSTGREAARGAAASPVVVHAAGVPAADAVRQARGGDGQEPGAAVQARMGAASPLQTPVYVTRVAAIMLRWKSRLGNSTRLLRAPTFAMYVFAILASYGSRRVQNICLAWGLFPLCQSSVYPVCGSIA